MATTYFEKLIQRFEELANDDSEESFKRLINYLEYRDDGTYEKHIIPHLACRALIQRGRIGIEAIIQTSDKIDGFIYPVVIMESLWLASRGLLSDPLFIDEANLANLSFEIPKETQDFARDQFINLILRSYRDPESFDRLVGFLYHQNMKSASSEQRHRMFHEDIFGILSESSISISTKIIEEFELALDSQLREEEYQLLLKHNPVFVDPLASDVLDKHRLGDDLITDFVVTTLQGQYILVEIEKPQDPIFTTSGDFSSKFSHAFGQVIDFIEWIESNISYAQKKLPGISAPKGVLIMGRSQNMSELEIKKLRRFNRNSNSIEVFTYDDVLTRAKNLYSNMKRKASFSVPSRITDSKL